MRLRSFNYIIPVCGLKEIAEIATVRTKRQIVVFKNTHQHVCTNMDWHQENSISATRL